MLLTRSFGNSPPK